MTHGRLHALTDGIFAIVMTLLVLELKLPDLGHSTSTELWHILTAQSTLFISYIISFAVLFVYWRAHNFVITVMAKNIDINLLNINGLFLLLVGIVPFTTHILGAFGDTSLGITIYALNVILIGLTLIGMRYYVENSESIDSLERTREQRHASMIRTMTPVICATIAIPISLISTQAAFAILIFAVIYNLHNNAASITRSIFIKPYRKLRSIVQ